MLSICPVIKDWLESTLSYSQGTSNKKSPWKFKVSPHIKVAGVAEIFILEYKIEMCAKLGYEIGQCHRKPNKIITRVRILMSSFFPCEIDDAIQYINLGYGAQAPKIVIL